MSQYEQERAAVYTNLPDAGTDVGDLASHGADLGVDATNSLGSITADTQSIAADENCACATPADPLSGGNTPGDQFNGSLGGLGE